MNTLEKIKAELAAFEEKKKAFVEELRKEFPTMFKEVFDKSEKIQSFGWVQYTPFFNDGDTCEFNVYCDDPYVNGDSVYDCDWYDWRVKYYLKGDKDYVNLLIDNPNLDTELHKIIDEFKDVINSIPEDFLKDLFGDHAQVTIHRDGNVEVEYYDHD
jgi:hypothetical protein